MMKRTHNIAVLASLTVVMAMSSCSSDKNSPGIEYMPDMYRSPAIEAYVDYGQDPYYFSDSLARRQRNTSSAMLPPEGTIPFSADASKTSYSFPYPYPNTNDGYEQAGRELRSPIKMTEATVDNGKEIYEKMCLHCHGDKGAGDGLVVTVGGHTPPTAYNGPVLKALSEGKMFHTLTYGKGMMGSHASQLTKEERWLVIQYVKFLQNDEKMGTAAVAPASTDSTATTNTNG